MPGYHDRALLKYCFCQGDAGDAIVVFGWYLNGKAPWSPGAGPFKKSIYSLSGLHEILLGCNRR